MLIDETTKQMETDKREQRKLQQELKQQYNFRQAAIKHFGNKNLLGGEMKTLLKQVSNKDDSPLRSKVAELWEQLHRRGNRLQVYNLFGSSNVNNESEESEGGDVANSERASMEQVVIRTNMVLTENVICNGTTSTSDSTISI
jgi:hypothetical protein